MKTIINTSVRYLGLGCCIVSLFLLNACYQFTEFDFEQQDPKLVLNYMVEADSVVYARLSQTYVSYQGLTKIPKEPDYSKADLSLYINGSFVEKMKIYTDTMLYATPTYSQGADSITTQYITTPVYYHYFLSNTVVHENDIVGIVASVSGHPEISGETVAVRKVDILSADTVITHRVGWSDGFYTMRTYIKFKDMDAGKKNYYGFTIEADRKEYVNDTLQISFYGNNTLVDYDYSLDPVLSDGIEGQLNDIFGLGGSTMYSNGSLFKLFSDELFNGGEYTLNVSFNAEYSRDYIFKSSDHYPWYSDYYNDGDHLQYFVTYRIKLYALSESAYLYFKSVQEHNSASGGLGEYGLVEPVRIFSNIKGGLGLAGSFKEDIKAIEMAVK